MLKEPVKFDTVRSVLNGGRQISPQNRLKARHFDLEVNVFEGDLNILDKCWKVQHEAEERSRRSEEHVTKVFLVWM